MDKQFDELSKSLAEAGVSRREALQKLGKGLTGIAMAAIGLGGAGSVQAQGSSTCCFYTCDAQKGKQRKVCMPPGYGYPNPGSVCGGFPGTLDSAKSVTDCATCNK